MRRPKVNHERDLWSERGRDLPTCVFAAFIVTLRMQIVNRAAYMYPNYSRGIVYARDGRHNRIVSLFDP